MGTKQKVSLEEVLECIIEVGVDYDVAEQMIKDYAKQKCKEQREICSQFGMEGWLSKDLEDCPEPLFD